MEKAIEIFDTIDRSLFVLLNGFHSPFFDFLMLWASDRFIWVPFYMILVYFIVRQYQYESILILLFIAGLVILTDQTTSGILKPFFERFRPCHDPELREYTHLVGGCGGRYGFASSHAANTFGVAMFLWLLWRHVYSYAGLLFVWAGFVSYSRIYLGVHYPGDIITGAAIGMMAGYLLYILMLWIRAQRTKRETDWPSADTDNDSRKENIPEKNNLL